MISNCIFTWGFTSLGAVGKPRPLLWIDFKLYFYVRIHKMLSNAQRWRVVVNWFQIVFLREDSQVKSLSVLMVVSCELISNCIFTWGFTSNPYTTAIHVLLWIDFKLYFYVRIHKNTLRDNVAGFVVNWFQIVFLREDSQGRTYQYTCKFCCELISNCIFTWGFTSATTTTTT